MFKEKSTILDFSILLVYFSMPIEAIPIIDNFSIAKLAILLLFLTSIPYLITFRIDNICKLFCIYSLYAMLSIIWSINQDNTLSQILSFLLPTLIATIIISNRIKSKLMVGKILIFYVIGCIINCFYVIINREKIIMEAAWGEQERVSAFGQDQNTLAFFMTLGICILLNFHKYLKNRIVKNISIVLILLFVFTILLTGSRTGLIITGTVFILYLISIKKYKYIITFILILCLTTIVMINYLPEGVIERFMNTSDLIESGDFSSRGYIWSKGINAFMTENNLFGVGYNNFSELLSQHYNGWKAASHNTYLTYLVEFGLIGMFTFLIILYKLIKYSLNIYKIKNDLLIFSFLIPLFIIMFSIETEYKRWLFLFGVILYNYYIIIKKDIYHENT